MQFALSDKFSEKELLLFLKRLYEWRDWIRDYPDDVYILSDTTEILASRNLYPVGDILKSLAKAHNIVSVQAVDLDKFMSELFRKAKKIDELCVNSESDLKSVKFTKVANEQLPERAKNIDEGLEKLLWFTNCHKTLFSSQEGSYVVFANGITGEHDLTLIGEQLKERDGSIDIKEVKETMRANFRTSIKEFLTDENAPILICQNVEKKGDLDFAIRVSIYQYKKLKTLKDAYLGFSFYVQDSFFKDFCKNHYPSQPGVLRSLMEAIPHTVLDVNLKQRHPLRTGKGGNNAQKLSKDKSYSAWRRFVTQSIKMHYWQKDNDFWFANVEEHDFDWIIEEFHKPKSLTLQTM